MINYEVTVFTGNLALASTFNNVYITLVGTDGESKRIDLTSWKPSFFRGQVSLKPLCILKLFKTTYKQKRFLQDSWYPAKVEVKSPKNKTYHFPIYHWITDSEVYCFREGTGLWKCACLIYTWDVYAQGIPHCIKGNSIQSLPYDVHFSLTKTAEMKYTAVTGMHQDSLGGDSCIPKSSKKYYFPDFVHKHWKEDSLFGYQFLNGVNPMLIRCCKALPKNFPVTGDMVSLHGRGSLADEMMKGNIFLCDYKLLDGVQPNTINKKKQYLMAPLILLQKTPDNKLMPIAIQLKQKPAKDNPIFLPTDSEYDWLMAKIFVRSADFNFYEVSVHLLRTHLLAEVFTVSLLRNLPMVHPLYKLLMPHTRYTLQINYLLLTCICCICSLVCSFWWKGCNHNPAEIVISLTYSSLCIPDDIAERGLKDVPNFYYRDDGLKLWEIIFRFSNSPSECLLGSTLFLAFPLGGIPDTLFSTYSAGVPSNLTTNYEPKSSAHFGALFRCFFFLSCDTLLANHFTFPRIVGGPVTYVPLEQSYRLKMPKAKRSKVWLYFTAKYANSAACNKCFKVIL
uniref:Lipoxygenase domain-containing protein n=1 Tax=Maylandia zebra TaxID=106582 RepID=A0A3P9C0N0_9CICH